MSESGLFQVLWNKNTKPEDEDRCHKDLSTSARTLYDVQLAFHLILAGFLLSGIVLLFEYFSFRRHRHLGLKVRLKY